MVSALDSEMMAAMLKSRELFLHTDETTRSNHYKATRSTRGVITEKTFNTDDFN